MGELLNDPEFWVAVCICIFVFFAASPAMRIINQYLDCELNKIKSSFGNAELAYYEAKQKLDGVQSEHSNLHNTVDNILSRAESSVVAQISHQKKVLLDEVALKEKKFDNLIHVEENKLKNELSNRFLRYVADHAKSYFESNKEVESSRFAHGVLNSMQKSDVDVK
jgi:F0F1-type ATP synthase membrane subunit b/b'